MTSPVESSQDTPEMLRKRLRDVNNSIVCVISDRDRDPDQVFEAMQRYVTPLRDKIRRLKYKHDNSVALAAHTEQLLLKQQAKLKKILRAVEIKKLALLLDKINAINTGTGSKRRKKLRNKNFERMRKYFTSDRLLSCRYLIKALETEYRLLQNPSRIKLQIEELEAAVNKARQLWKIFLRNHFRGEAYLDELYSIRDGLQKRVGTDHKVDKLKDQTNKLLAMMLKLTPQQIQAAMSNVKRSS